MSPSFRPDEAGAASKVITPIALPGDVSLGARILDDAEVTLVADHPRARAEIRVDARAADHCGGFFLNEGRRMRGGTMIIGGQILMAPTEPAGQNLGAGRHVAGEPGRRPCSMIPHESRGGGPA